MDLEIDSLACRRAGRIVFRDLDFRLRAGEAAALRGPNGVGKSTLLRVLAGLIPPAGGDARLGATSLTRDRGGFQEQVAYAGHLDAVKPALGVAENLAVWAGLHATDGARVAAALDRFGIGHIATHPAAQCSAGQKRRLGLARLLVIDRPLWLLDEPTVSLDAASAAQVADLVREHCAGGGMALIATHIELGLGHGPVLEMRAPDDTAGSVAADPFLEGAW
ncbi:MAG: heme ABC exporter ATP-binding protein CcmA [Thermohalobaculum sp.]|nr:heme ABC exporter ATP-binding protein CcmA [Thermohalobaculum sp.]